MPGKHGTAIERFWRFVSPEPNSGCWLWTGTMQDDGYGRFRVGSSEKMRAHRFAYQHFKGPIPGDLVIDHKCRVRCCVNPDHLEAVTIGENIRRGETRFNNGWARRTHCLAGHPYSPENTLMRERGNRRCRTCERERARLRHRGRH